jgi:hypothetical protein
MKNFKILLLIIFSQLIYCQDKKTVNLNFAPIYNEVLLNFDNQHKADFQITTLKFFVSHFDFYNKQKLIFSSNKNGFLIDVSKPESMNQKLEIPVDCNFDELKFYFGIDDKTNNNAISDGDLDPSNGMYWTWQTGYINMKLEGIYNKNKEFQFHLGGFIEPFVSFQTIELNNISNQNEIKIKINLNAFFDKISLNETNTIMSPSKKAVELSVIAAKMFGL